MVGQSSLADAGALNAVMFALSTAAIPASDGIDPAPPQGVAGKDPSSSRWTLWQMDTAGIDSRGCRWRESLESEPQAFCRGCARDHPRQTRTSTDRAVTFNARMLCLMTRPPERLGAMEQRHRQKAAPMAPQPEPAMTDAHPLICHCWPFRRRFARHFPVP